MCGAKGNYSITMPNIVRAYMQSKGNDNMQIPTSSEWVWFPRAIMVCQAQRYWTLSMLFKGDDGLPRLTSFDHVLWPRARMECLTLCSPIVYVIQWRGWHSTHNLVPPCMLYNGDNGIPFLTSSNHVCRRRAMRACQA